MLTATINHLRVLDVGARFGYHCSGLFERDEAPHYLGVEEISILLPYGREEVAEADLVCFGGGADVSPEFYGHVNHASYTDTARDLWESELFDLCLRMGKPMLGICRGAQFLNVMNGGTMIQDVKGHGFTHYVVSPDGHRFRVTSTHHQMMVPGKEGSVLLLGEGDLHKGEIVYDGERPDLPGDVEAVYYPRTLCLGVQGHPEYDDATDEFCEWVWTTIKEKLL